MPVAWMEFNDNDRVDRSYLPYKSAREYQDRGMVKWMGFFLSEHNSALKQAQTVSRESPMMAESDKLLALTQLFLSQQLAELSTVDPLMHYQGRVSDYNDQSIYFTTKEGIKHIPLQQIRSLTLLEEFDDD